MDTNVLVYAHYRGESLARRSEARAVLGGLFESSSACISPQVITEFLNVVRRKLADEVTYEEALEIAAALVFEYEIIVLDAVTTREALRCAARYRLDYLDAQIWAAARVGGCDVILTEDTHGDQIEGVRYVNPFVEGFDLATLSG